MKRLSIILADIEKYLKEFEELKVNSLDDLKDRKNFYAASMVLFTLFNRVIDLGEEIVLRKGLGTPATYRDIFRLLERARIIEKNLLKKLEELVLLRNRLSHQYFAFTEKDVLEGMKKIKVVKEFVECIRS